MCYKLCLTNFKHHKAAESDSFDWINAGGGYSLKEIGDYFDLRHSTVSEIIRNHKSNI